jgi:hypothetical protein
MKKTILSKKRYPGPQPFSPEDKAIFFGRNNDIQALLEYLDLFDFVTLYSQSGLGKSSLLNAGIIPALNQLTGLTCVKVRLGSYSDYNAKVPLVASKEQIADQLNTTSNDLINQLIPNDNSLWSLLKSYYLNGGNKEIILVFDQFEELFSHSKESITQFKHELSELINAQVPLRFRNELEHHFIKRENTFTDEELDALHEPLSIKVLIAIRSDRMSLLNNLSDKLPNILQNCYELKPLSRSEAEEAILEPAYLKGDYFVSPVFDYEDDAIEDILSFLINDKSGGIESFQLQIVCQHLENLVIREQRQHIQQKDLANLGTLYETYYKNKLALLTNPEERQTVRKLIEEGLIFEEEERRLSLYEGQIYQHYQISPELLKRLVDFHLLRAEPSIKGGYTYEITHDTLVHPIVKAKRERLQVERQEAARLAALEREAELEKLRAKNRKERKAKNRAMMVAAIAIISALVAVFAVIKAQRSDQQAREAFSALQLKQDTINEVNLRLQQQLLAIASSEYNLLVEAARRKVAEGNYQDAIGYYQQALDRATDTTAAFIIDQGGQQAQAGLEEAIALSASSSAFTAAMGLAQRLEANSQASDDDLLNAKSSYQQAIDKAANDTQRANARTGLASVNNKLKTRAAKYKERAILRKVDDGNQDACNILKQALRLDPSSKEIKALLGHCN